MRKALRRLTGAALVDERAVKEFIKELQRILISNDVNVGLVFRLSKKIEEKALRESPPKGMSPKEHVVRIVYEELARMMGERYEPRIEPHRVLLLGLFGSGKTTTAAKLAKFYKEKGLKPALVCCDTYRPAAYEQLKQLAELINVPFYGMKDSNPEFIIRNALDKLSGNDVLILDSSGRNAFDEELKEELSRIDDIFKPDERFLVVSADIGQIAGKQAQEFNATVPLTGVIVTKVDGSGRGGGALSAVAATGARVAFIGTGEKMDDFELFDAKKYVGRLLGFPDLEALLEKVKKLEKEVSPEKLMDEKFTLQTFHEQLKATKKLGPLKNIFGMLGMVDLPKDLMRESEEKLKVYEAILNSMTPEERMNPQLIRKSRSRVERIARGSGRSVEEVKKLLNEFSRMEKVMKAFKRDRGFRKRMEKFFAGANLT